jgi:hypothetical protein
MFEAIGEIDQALWLDPRTVRSGSQTTIREQKSGAKSGGETFVAVMQAIDLWNGDYSPALGWHDRAWIRTILIE